VGADEVQPVSSARRCCLAGLVPLVLLILPASVAGVQVPAPLPRLESAIEFDGRVHEAAWDVIEPLPMTMYSPIYRGEPSERTEIFVAYDDDYLYAAGRFFDSDPQGIRVNSLYRDRWSGDDVFALFVDSFNDNVSARRFTINPAGIRIDELIGADGQERNMSWDTHWDVRTTTDSLGWYFEIRIPFSSLRFQVTGNRTIMGITVSRLIARKNERVTFPDIDPRFSFRQPSVSHDFLLTGIQSAQPAYVTPYLLSGVDRSYQGGEFATDRIGELGLDLKYSLGDNLFLDASANTDFAQVEADDQQINLTRFPLFFPEKRQFFQERSDIFLFDFGNGNRLFHSRRIGLSDDRSPVRMLGGARLAGRLGGWDLGVLNMQSGRHGNDHPENFGVARIRRTILNPHSHIGGMVTSRAGASDASGLAGGLDATIRLFGDHYTTLRWAGTHSPERHNGSFADASQLYVNWERRADRGLRYWVTLNRVGPTHSPDVGFLSRQNFTRNSLYAVYNTRGRDGSLFRSLGPGVILNTFFSNVGSELETLYLGHWWNYELWNGASGWLQVTHRFEKVVQTFDLGDGVFVPNGDHRFTNLWFSFTSGPGSLVRTAFDMRVGSFYDGSQVELQIAPVWNVSRHLEVSGEYTGNFLRFADRGEHVHLHLARLRIGAAASARLSANALIQYNSLSDLIGVNLRIRYHLRQGTDFWVVYDEGLRSDRTVDDALIRPPLSNTRAVRIKLTYTWALGS